eukprot:jgi/Mesen1/5287/ME000263S04397
MPSSGTSLLPSSIHSGSAQALVPDQPSLPPGKRWGSQPGGQPGVVGSPSQSKAFGLEHCGGDHAHGRAWQKLLALRGRENYDLACCSATWPSASRSSASWRSYMGSAAVDMVPSRHSRPATWQAPCGYVLAQLDACGAEEVAPTQQGTLREIRSQDLVIRRTTTPLRKPELSTLTFGAFYTDHLLSATWNALSGWSPPSITPMAPLQLHPCAQVLHYAMECFEGMKAWQHAAFPAGPQHGAAAALRGAPAEFLECIKQFLREEESWIPAKEGYSIYLRPTMIATTPFLGVGPPSDALLFVVLAPVGPYFPTGLRPIRLYVDTWHTRAAAGGVGDSKVGGNYAPTIRPQVQAAQKGCAQDGHGGGGLVGESGAMNVFFLLKNDACRGGMELVTPPLNGLILPGVTRDSVLALAREWGEFDVSERSLRFEELETAHAEGRLLEVFGTGTAVVIQPISGLVLADGRELAVPFDEVACSHWTNMPPGTAARAHSHAARAAAPEGGGVHKEPFSLSGRLFRTLADIQYGHVAHEWSVVV